MDTAVVIMAAGLGSRFGEGIKQLGTMGPNGESIMEYSIHDAIEAGFNRVVFILRKDIEEEFNRVVGRRIRETCEALGVRVDHAFQSLTDLPEGFSLPAGRTKPWGTAQAVLACRDILDCPFVVLNADDYYGKEAFRQIHHFLTTSVSRQQEQLCMAGFVLKNTLADSGGVSRAICQIEEGYLTSVLETHNIRRATDGEGRPAAEANGTLLDPEVLVSMNIWGLTPKFMEYLESGFQTFLRQIAESEDRETQEQKAEYLLPICINRLLQRGDVAVRVLPTHDRWFGVTYQEDKETVISEFRALADRGVYSTPLFADLLDR